MADWPLIGSFVKYKEASAYPFGIFKLFIQVLAWDMHSNIVGLLLYFLAIYIVK
jgi:hypothetical protein